MFYFVRLFTNKGLQLVGIKAKNGGIIIDCIELFERLLGGRGWRGLCMAMVGVLL